jgi:thymidylate kinase
MPDLGKLIVFEGADGVGKSTLVGRTEVLLKANGCSRLLPSGR